MNETPRRLKLLLLHLICLLDLLDLAGMQAVQHGQSHFSLLQGLGGTR